MTFWIQTLIIQARSLALEILHKSHLYPHIYCFASTKLFANKIGNAFEAWLEPFHDTLSAQMLEFCLQHKHNHEGQGKIPPFDFHHAFPEALRGIFFQSMQNKIGVSV